MFLMEPESVARCEKFPPQGSERSFAKGNKLGIFNRSIFINIPKSQPIGGDPDSTGGMRQRLHARDAVGPLKNGIHIIANDYEVAVAA
jgi:hypothetical protein